MASNDHDNNVETDHEHGSASQLGKTPECREALDRLYRYLDGELTEVRRREIKTHLETCMPCLEAFDFEAELKLLIAKRCRDEVPAHLQLRVREALAVASGASDPGDASDPGALEAKPDARDTGAE